MPPLFVVSFHGNIECGWMAKLDIAGYILELIKLMILDVDDVFTDGKITIDTDAEDTKSCYVQDGLRSNTGKEAVDKNKLW